MHYYQQKESENDLLVRGFENTQENFANFSAELWQLLTRSFDNRRVADSHAYTKCWNTDFNGLS